MVQWIEHIATWLEPLVERMWQAMCAGGYLQVDETPVKVLDPEVRGKAAQGYLWFYAVPGGDVLLQFDSSRDWNPSGGAWYALPARSRRMRMKSTTRSAGSSLASSVSAVSLTLGATYTRLFRKTFPNQFGSIALMRSLYRIEDEISGAPAEQRMPSVSSEHPRSGMRS